jgi:hypothetical protein
VASYFYNVAKKRKGPLGITPVKNKIKTGTA